MKATSRSGCGEGPSGEIIGIIKFPVYEVVHLVPEAVGRGQDLRARREHVTDLGRHDRAQPPPRWLASQPRNAELAAAGAAAAPAAPQPRTDPPPAPPIRCSGR